MLLYVDLGGAAGTPKPSRTDWSTNQGPVHFTAWLENTDLSIWLRESPSLLAFPFVLIVHAWGMGILAGSNAALDLRIIGFAPRVSLSAMEKFYPVLWFGFTINAISGILLLISYPTKALTNPVFYLKIGCIAAGMVMMVKIRDRVVRNPACDIGPLPTNPKILAGVSLFFWATAIISGRFLAYTCKYLIAGRRC